MPKYQSSSELCVTAVTSAGMRLMRAGVLQCPGCSHAALTQSEHTAAGNSLLSPSLSYLGCPKQARTSSGQDKHRVFKEFPSHQGFFPCSAPSAASHQWALAVRAQPPAARAAREEGIYLLPAMGELSTPTKPTLWGFRAWPVPLTLCKAYFYMKCPAHGSSDNETVFEYKWCSFLCQFEKQLFLDSLLSGTHPACYVGRLCFYPDFLPRAHPSAIPRVPPEAEASAGVCPYRLHRMDVPRLPELWYFS